MHNTANVYLWGTHVGTVLLQDESPIAKFQYADEFLDMGVEVSPLRIERKARAVLDEVRSAVRDWLRFAAEAEVRDDFVGAISRQLDTTRS